MKNDDRLLQDSFTSACEWDERAGSSGTHARKELLFGVRITWRMHVRGLNPKKKEREDPRCSRQPHLKAAMCSRT